MASQRRLIGEDGWLGRGVLGAEVVGNAILTIAKGAWVQITAKAAVSSAFGGLAVGSYYYAPASVVPVVGDKWKVLTLTKMLDTKGWSLELSSDEIDVTVNADVVKTYRRGKADANGSVQFIYIAGITDVAGGLANKFFNIVNIDNVGVVTIDAKDNSFLYLVGYLNEGSETDAENNIAIATIMKVELFSFTLPSKMGEAGEMDVPLRLADALDLNLYRIELA